MDSTEYAGKCKAVSFWGNHAHHTVEITRS
jgi:hypothetical protein